MSGKHQRRMWVLPVPTGSTSKYDRMQLAVGRANSTNILIEHDTLTKTLLNYLFQQDTFIKALTNISRDTDTIITVFVNFNYIVDHDTLIKITKSIPPVPVSESFGGGSGRILNAPIGVHKKKKKADEIIKLDKLNVSKLLSKKFIQLRVDALLDVSPIVVDAKLITINDIQNLTVLNVNFIDITDTTPIEVKVLHINKEETKND